MLILTRASIGGEGDPNREARLQDVQFDAFLEHDYHDDTIGDLEDKITIEGLAEQMSGVTLEPGTYFEDIIDNYLENRKPRIRRWESWFTRNRGYQPGRRCGCWGGRVAGNR